MRPPGLRAAPQSACACLSQAGSPAAGPSSRDLPPPALPAKQGQGGEKRLGEADAVTGLMSLPLPASDGTAQNNDLPGSAQIRPPSLQAPAARKARPELNSIELNMAPTSASVDCPRSGLAKQHQLHLYSAHCCAANHLKERDDVAGGGQEQQRTCRAGVRGGSASM